MTQEKIVSQIRELSRSSRGQTLSLLSLSDEALYAAYHHLKSGAGNRATARLLQEKYLVATSENALQQAVGKLKKKIHSLLRPESNSLAPLQVEAKSLRLDENLEEIGKSYGQLIEEKISEAKDTGILSPELHKHVTALANLVKTRAQVNRELSLHETSRAEALEIREFGKRADRAHSYLTNNGQDTEKMIRAATEFIQGIEKKCVNLEINKETGEYELV